MKKPGYLKWSADLGIPSGCIHYVHVYHKGEEGAGGQENFEGGSFLEQYKGGNW